MPTPYTRQSAFANGDVIDAPLFNAEFDQLVTVSLALDTYVVDLADNLVTQEAAANAAAAAAQVAQVAAELAETNAEAAAASMPTSLVVATKAEFFALAEKRIRDNAGSGFTEWGKHRDNGGSIRPVNQGLSTDAFATPNALDMGCGDLAASQAGSSRTNYPIASINGVTQVINQIVNSAENYQLNKFLLPPAPDGTKTYDSATGTLVTHASSNEAFEGLVTNGDFRNGTTGWGTRGGATISVTNGVMTITDAANTADSAAKQTMTVTVGQTYKVEAVARSVTGVAAIYAQQGSTVFTKDSTSSTSFTNLSVTFTASVTGTVEVGAREEGSNGTGQQIEIVSFSMMPVTESVITSRQDFVFLESFHEKISDKDVVYPLGNVQYGATTWDSIALSNALVAQGYSAFGEWDTTTGGHGVVWSTLSEAHKVKFLQDPENNIYSEDGELIQVRYRMRVIEGLGDEWDNVGIVFSNNFWRYDNANRPRVRGTSTDSNDYTGGIGCFANNTLEPITNLDVGLFGARANATNALRAHNGLCFAIPIALVQRRNQGAYHPVYNPNGCGRFWKDNGSFSMSDWYSSTSKVPSSLADCMNIGSTPTTGDIAPFARPTYGAISVGAGGAGRSDDKYYDAIYASDVSDLRMSSKLLPVAEIREKYKRMAIAGEVRGFESVPFTLVPVAQNTIASAFMSGGRTIFKTAIAPIWTDDVPISEGPVGYIQFGNIIYKGTWIATGTEGRFAADEVHGDVRSTIPTSSTVWAISEREQLHKQANPTWTDIIGDPANIAATFPNGVEGQWIPVIPDDVTRYLPLSRKSTVSATSTEYTHNNGSSWTTKVAAISSTNNDIQVYGATTFKLGVVSLEHYETQAHFTADAVNSVVLDMGGVYATGRHDVNYGGVLVTSLLNKVATNNNSIGGINLPLNGYTLIPNGKLWHSTPQANHETIELGSGDNPTVKTLDYLSQENKVATLNYAYKEMVYDSGADGTPDATPIDGTTSQTYTDGVLYRIDNLSVVYYVVALGNATLVFSTLGLVGDYWTTTGGTGWFKQWDGNGWGDNNKFEILDNQGTQTDDNGNSVLYGTASFDTQYFVVEE